MRGQGARRRTHAGLEFEVGAAEAARGDVQGRDAVERLPGAQPLRG